MPRGEFQGGSQTELRTPGPGRGGGQGAAHGEGGAVQLLGEAYGEGSEMRGDWPRLAEIELREEAYGEVRESLRAAARSAPGRGAWEMPKSHSLT